MRLDAQDGMRALMYVGERLQDPVVTFFPQHPASGRVGRWTVICANAERAGIARDKMVRKIMRTPWEGSI